MDGDYALYQQYQADRKQKQQYLVENIQNMGYDAGDFAHYLGWQRGKYSIVVSDLIIVVIQRMEPISIIGPWRTSCSVCRTITSIVRVSSSLSSRSIRSNQEVAPTTALRSSKLGRRVLPQ